MDKKVGILIVIIIVVLGLLVGGYFLFFAPKEEETQKLVADFYYSPGDAFITNVPDTENSLLKVTLTFGTSRDVTEEMKLKNAVLRDTVLQVLRETTKEELQTTTEQQMLSERICLELNKLLDPANITYAGAEGDSSAAQYVDTPLFTHVYFTDLVMQ